MPTMVTVAQVARVQFGAPGDVVIIGKQASGSDIEIIFRTADAKNIAVPLLCAAAVEDAPPPRPTVGTAIYGCFLPVMNWSTGHIALNREPTLTFHVAGGSTLQFQMPSQTAIACGRALQDEGISMSPTLESRPH